MKLIVSALLAVSAAAVSLPASANVGMLIGTQVDNTCKRQAQNNGIPNPSDAWMNQCRQAAREQDSCVINTGWTQGSQPNTATNACWQTFSAKCRSIPKN